MKIALPLEAWVDAFAPIERRTLSRLMAGIGDRLFSEFLDFWLFDTGRQSIGKLAFDRQPDDARALRLREFLDGQSAAQWPELPIAEVAMPENIQNFVEIGTNFFNGQMFEFFRRIQPLLHNVNLWFGTECPFSRDDSLDHQLDGHLRQLLPMLASVDGIFHLNTPYLEFFYSEFREVFLAAKMLSIRYFLFYQMGMHGLMPILQEWLTRNVGKPKVLSLHYLLPKYVRSVINALIQDFRNSTQATCFIVRFETPDFRVLHELPGRYENEQTHESIKVWPVERFQSAKFTLCCRVPAHVADNDPWWREIEEQMKGFGFDYRGYSLKFEKELKRKIRLYNGPIQAYVFDDAEEGFKVVQ